MDLVGGGVIGAPRACKPEDAQAKSHPPTPLDGLNHPMPSLAPSAGTQTGAPRIVEWQPQKKKPSSQDFRFSAAVDVPSPEEQERREKEQLVVAGSVTGPDGQGIAMVIVYLTDEQGNRVGQSGRSVAETGEFKVLVNEPGRYFLNAYKRGYVPEIAESTLLPIESGKIEGYEFKMIPEGCLVSGTVFNDPSGMVVPGVEVKCVSRTGEFSRSSFTNAEGHFRISAIPVNSECHLEVLSENGKVIGESHPFETVQKKEISQDIRIPADPITAKEDTRPREKKVTLRNGEAKRHSAKRATGSGSSTPAAP
jgi:hypothetical protein